MALKIIWSKEALENISKAIEWISHESILQAEKVESNIINKIEESAIHPEKYPKDKYKLNNAGEYRAFETQSYRVSYRYTKSDLQVLRIRHVKQIPKNY